MNRRKLLAAVPALTMLGGADAAVAAPAASVDAELIRVCHRFAEAEFAAWYEYIVTDDEEIVLAHESRKPDKATLRQIEATPARTLEGLQAKALACFAWDHESYDSHAGGFRSHSTTLGSVLRDLVTPARAAIIARLAERYGPLPKGYTPDGVWIGSAAA